MGNDSFLPTILASSTTGMLARLPLHPVDTLKAKVQSLPSGSSTSILSCARTILQSEGIAGFYRGIGIALFGSVPAGCLYFTSYEAAKSILNARAGSDQHQDLVNFSSGMAAEAVSCMLWVPIDVIKERLQVQSTFKGKQYHYTGSMDAVRQVMRHDGVLGIYRGYGATVLSFGPFSAFYFMFYEKLKKQWLDHSELGPNLPAAVYALNGGMAGAAASFLTNPLDMAKLRIQIERSSCSSTNVYNYRNMLHGIYRIAVDEGVSTLFKGAGARMLFHAPSTAISITLFEKMKTMYKDLLSSP